MKSEDRKLAYAAILVFSVIAVELAWLLLMGPAQGSPACGTGNTPQCDLPWWDSAAFWTAAFTFFLTVSTGLLWWQTRRLAEVAETQSLDIQAQIKATEAMARAAQQSADAADNAIAIQSDGLKKQLRPFVSVKRFNVGGGLDNPVNRNIIGFEIAATFENTGATPAINMTSRIAIGIFPAGIPDNFRYPEVYDADAVEGPVNVIGSHGTLNSGVLRLPLAEALSEPNKFHPTYVWGSVDYDDTFDGTPRYRTEFCAKVDLRRPLERVPENTPIPDFLLMSVRGPYNNVDGASMNLPNPSKKHPNSDKPIAS